MKVVGVGIDIVDIDRVKELMSANRYFKKRVFTEWEIAYCKDKKKKWQHFAVRFAAKEAVWKALGKGGIALNNIEIRNKKSGSPEIKFNNKSLHKNYQIHISLTHSEHQAIACAFVTKKR